MQPMNGLHAMLKALLGAFNATALLPHEQLCLDSWRASCRRLQGKSSVDNWLRFVSCSIRLAGPKFVSTTAMMRHSRYLALTSRTCLLQL
jgi:hypothetical protein